VLTKKDSPLRMSVICSTGTRPAVSLTNSADSEKMNAAQSIQQVPELHSRLQKITQRV
jgi:hypothetical protein